MSEKNIQDPVKELTPSEPLPIPQLIFPSAIQSENEKVFANEDLAAQHGSGLPLGSEHPAHDPLAAILEKNVTETRDIIASEDNSANAAKGHIIEVSKFYLQFQQTQKIHLVLKTHGMDSQQAEKALKEIRSIIEG